MITLLSKFIGSQIEFEFHTGPRDPVTIKVTKKGEHQDEPTHKYYKADEVITINTNAEDLAEMVRQLEKLI